MAFTNFDTREINAKVLYLGPQGAGKSANLRSLLQATSPELKSGLLELGDGSAPAQYFEFLPISIGRVRDFHLKLHLYTLPTNPLYETVTSVMLRGLDGFVFVADARVEAMADNLASLAAARRLLTAEGYQFAELPRVIQYNKTDLGQLVPIETLRQELNATGAPDQKAVATQGIGTLETLQAMSRLVREQLGA